MLQTMTLYFYYKKKWSAEKTEDTYTEEILWPLNGHQALKSS